MAVCAAPAFAGVPTGEVPSRQPVRPVLPEPADDTLAVAAAPADARPATVTTHRVAVRLDDVPAADWLARIRSTPGVAHATRVQVGRLQVGTGPDAAALDVAAVDPDGHRPFAPAVVADTVGVWDRLDEGAIAVTHEHAGRLGLELGGDVRLGGDPGVPVRVGAFASNGVPPVAEAIVDRATGRRLGIDRAPHTILVGVAHGASAADVAARLRAALDHQVTVVPDPRAPAPTPVGRVPAGPTVWDTLAMCESSGRWDANTGNGYYGGLQFLPESWWMVGGAGMPHEATREEQIRRAERLLALQGWKAWPVCSIRIGLREAP